MRVALKLGYIGTNYHGFQIQPDVPTVSSVILNALEELNIIENRHTAAFSFAGRTDRGVHAISQVISFETKNPDISVRMINSALPDDIFVIAIAYPYQKFNARKDALWREYRYFLLDADSSLNIESMRIASSSLIGVHDFRNFAERDREVKTTVRHVLRIDIKRDGKFIIIDVRAHSFLRKMVRKMVTALKIVGACEKPPEWLSYLLHSPQHHHIAPAPACGLLLRDVKYNIEFEYDEYTLNRLKEKLKNEIFNNLTLSAVFEDMICCCKFP